MLDITPVYITVEDTKTNITELAWKSDETIESLIIKAQVIIDREIWFCWTKEDPDQCFIFPTCEDWLPKEIQLSIIELIKKLCEESASTSTTSESDCDNWCSGAIKSVKVWEVTTTFFEKWCDDSNTDNFDYDWRSLLSKFTWNTILTNRKLKIKCKPKTLCQDACQCQTCTQ